MIRHASAISAIAQMMPMIATTQIDTQPPPKKAATRNTLAA